MQGSGAWDDTATNLSCIFKYIRKSAFLGLLRGQCTEEIKKKNIN